MRCLAVAVAASNAPRAADAAYTAGTTIVEFLPFTKATHSGNTTVGWHCLDLTTDRRSAAPRCPSQCRRPRRRRRHRRRSRWRTPLLGIKNGRGCCPQVIIRIKRNAIGAVKLAREIGTQGRKHS